MKIGKEGVTGWREEDELEGGRNEMVGGKDESRWYPLCHHFEYHENKERRQENYF